MKKRKIASVVLTVLLLLLYFGVYFGILVQILPSSPLRALFAALGLALAGALLWVGKCRCQEIKEENEDDYHNY